MQALILAGGEGTRLRPLTLNTPKPIVPIGNEPFLLRQIDSLKEAGVTEIILATGYHPSAIEKTLGDGSRYEVKLRYLIEPEPMGTAGAYKFAEEFLTTSTIVLNGDILTDIDLQKVAEQHRCDQAVATIVLTEVENPSVYGVVETDKENRVLRFLEKPKAEELSQININTINAGIYILEPRVLDYIPKGERHSFEYQLFPALLSNKENFRAFIARENYWLDIGTPERYLQAHSDLTAGKIKNLLISKSNKFQSASETEIDEFSWLGEDCAVSKKAKIINSVLGKNVTVGENSIVRNSIIWSGTKIGSDVFIENAIVGSDCRIGKNACLGSGSMLGDQTVISDYSRSFTKPV